MTKVLVVEDNINARDAIVDYLQRLGFHVESAVTGSEAIDLGANFRPEFLICDWILEGPFDGIGVTEKLLALNLRPKVIFITAMPLADLYRRCAHLEVKAFLAKPIDLKRLGGLVEAACSS